MDKRRPTGKPAPDDDERVRWQVPISARSRRDVLDAIDLALSASPGLRSGAQDERWRLLRRAFAALCLLLAIARPARAAEDDYHRLSLSAYALMAPGAPTIPTHLCVQGEVRYVRKERDGDVHIRLCDGALCVVAEIIPLLPLDRPRKGQRVEACGITRWDGWPGHGWAELHPLLSWRSAP